MSRSILNTRFVTRIFLTTNPIIQIVSTKRRWINRIRPLSMPTHHCYLIHIVTHLEFTYPLLISLLYRVKCVNRIWPINHRQLPHQQLTILDDQHIRCCQLSMHVVLYINERFNRYVYFALYELLINILLHYYLYENKTKQNSKIVYQFHLSSRNVFSSLSNSWIILVCYYAISCNFCNYDNFYLCILE